MSEERHYELRAQQHAGNVAAGAAAGLIGGLAGTLVMNLFGFGLFLVIGMPVSISFSIIGDAAAGFLSAAGVAIAGGPPLGAVVYYLLGPALGVIFAAAVSRIAATRTDSIQKGAGLGILYAEVVSLPMLAIATFILKMAPSATAQWFGISFVMHLVYGSVLGAVVSSRLRSATVISRRNGHDRTSEDEKDKTITVATPWWKGTRGEWYVVGQVALLGLVFFGPRTGFGWPTWTFPYTVFGSAGGGVLLVAGAVLVVAGIFRLGANLTAVPYPKDQSRLVETGPYRLVRHPMYSGGVSVAFGWAFLVHGWLTIGYAVILLVFFDIKARREERWLTEKFPGYAAYQRRVHKLIPFIY